MKRINNKKGFTLAELLIVIAIIAILIAIAVPVFSSSMRRSQKATDDANFRAAKSAAVTSMLGGTIDAYDSSGVIQTGLKVGDTTLGTDKLYFCTDGHFATSNAKLPDGVDYVTAKLNADASKDPTYNADAISGHVKGAKIYAFFSQMGDYDETGDGQGFDDYFILDSAYGMIYMGFGQ